MVLSTRWRRQQAPFLFIDFSLLLRPDCFPPRTRIKIGRWWTGVGNTIAIDYDAIISYMEIIREEERLAAIRGDYRRVEGLRNTLDNYRDEKQFYDSEVSKGAKNISATDIKAYYKELISLPLMGQLIKDIFAMEECGRLDASKYAENRYNHQVVRRASTLPQSHPPEPMFTGGQAAAAYPMSSYGAPYGNGPSIPHPSYSGQHAPRGPTIYERQPPMMGNSGQFDHNDYPHYPNYDHHQYYPHQYMERDGSSSAQWGYGAGYAKPPGYDYPHQAPPPSMFGGNAGGMSGGSGAGKPGPSSENRDLSDEKTSSFSWMRKKFGF